MKHFWRLSRPVSRQGSEGRRRALPVAEYAGSRSPDEVIEGVAAWPPGTYELELIDGVTGTLVLAARVDVEVGENGDGGASVKLSRGATSALGPTGRAECSATAAGGPGGVEAQTPQDRSPRPSTEVLAARIDAIEGGVVSLHADVIATRTHVLSVSHDVSEVGREVARRCDVDSLARQVFAFGARLDALERAVSANAIGLASVRETADTDRARAEHNSIAAAVIAMVGPPIIRAALAASEASQPPSIGSPPVPGAPP